MWCRNNHHHLPRLLALSLLCTLLVGTRSQESLAGSKLRRRLPGGKSHDHTKKRPCNAFLTTVSAEQIESVADFFLGSLTARGELSVDEAAKARKVYVDPIKYNVTVSKFCGTCSDFGKSPVAYHSEMWITYCGKRHAYAKHATFSGLVYLPMDDMTGAPIAANLNGYMSFQGTSIDLTSAPSVLFPDSVADLLASNDPDSIISSLIGSYGTMLAASAGAIGIEFDYLGTGESSNFPRSYLTKSPVETGSVVSWLAAQRYVTEATNGCTTLRNEAIVSGYSLGGVTALWGAVALKSIGVEIKRVFSQAAPYDQNMITWLAFLRVAAGGEVTPFLAFFVTFLFASYSNEMPFLSNTGTGQKILSPMWRDENNLDTNLLHLYFEEKPLRDELLSRMPTTTEAFLSVFDVTYQEAGYKTIGAASSKSDDPDYFTEYFPCHPTYNGNIQGICQAYDENSAYNTLDQIDFLVEWCHSPNDATVPFIFSALLSGRGTNDKKNNIVQSVPPNGYSFLSPTTESHVQAATLCLSANAHFFTLDDGNFNNIKDTNMKGGKHGYMRCPACLIETKWQQTDGPGLCKVKERKKKGRKKEE